MSTSNGSSEPSMEEILASIRNIIAQDPSHETESEPVMETRAGTAERVRAPIGGSFASIPSHASDARTGGAPQAQQPSFGGLRTAPPTAAAVDDFSDVFEEPLQTLPLTPSPKPAEAGPHRDSREADDHRLSTSATSRVPERNGAITPTLQATLPQSENLAAREASGYASGQGAERAGERAGFDFGTLRAPHPDSRQEPRFDRPAAGSAAPRAPMNSVPVPPAAVSAPVAGDVVPSLSQRLAVHSGVEMAAGEVAPVDVETPADIASVSDNAAAGPQRKVIAAMVGVPAPASQPAAPRQVTAPVVFPTSPGATARADASGEGTGQADGRDDVHVAEATVAQPIQTPAKAVSEPIGLKTANVGFLAANPRPIDPVSAAKTDAGRAFFQAVAGDDPDTGRPAVASGADDLKLGAEALRVAVIDDDDVPTEVSLPAMAEAHLPAIDAAPYVDDAAQYADRDSREAAADAENAGPVSASAADAGGEDIAAPVPAAATVGDAAGGSVPAQQSLTQGLAAANIVVSSEGGRVRTLEDTVAELLRPLLREWLENNMPRIVENALRLEVAESVKKQLTVPAGKTNGAGR